MDVIELKHQQALLTGSVPMYGEEVGEGEVLAPESEWYDWKF